MYNLFAKEDNRRMVERIGRIDSGSKAIWGKMSAGEMLNHCRQPIKVGLGELKLKRTLIGFLFGGIAKRQMLSDKPIKKGLPTDGNFIPKGNFDLNKEKAGLIEIVSRLSEKGPDGITKEPHPFFGAMTPEEWNTLTWKHLDHHLSQFGA